MAKDLHYIKDQIIIRMQKIAILFHEILDITKHLDKEELRQVGKLIQADPRMDDIGTAFDLLDKDKSLKELDIDFEPKEDEQ